MDIEIELNGQYLVKEIEKKLRTVRSKGMKVCQMEVTETHLVIKCR
jgi:acetolactate synthase regulatory subunit